MFNRLDYSLEYVLMLFASCDDDDNISIYTWNIKKRFLCANLKNGARGRSFCHVRLDSTRLETNDDDNSQIDDDGACKREHLLFRSASMETLRSDFSTMTRALLVTALLAHSILARPMSSCSIYRSKRILAFGLGRREALLRASSAVVGELSFVRTSPALAKEIDEEQVLATTTATTSPSFAAYSVTPDSSAFLNPSLQSIDVRTL